MTYDDVAGALNVSRETFQRLDSYVHLLEKWQRRINLISRLTVDEIWQRHIFDCAQTAQFFPRDDFWVDFGSGAGLPGLIVAILRREKQPGFSMCLVESNGKKCSFLLEASRTTGVSVQIFNKRIEVAVPELKVLGPTVITARALAPLSQLIGFAEPLFQRQAKAVFMKGATAEFELTEARKDWNIDAELIPSVTDVDGRLVVIHSANRRSG